jgi:dihydroflavonol-4-reductase
VLIKQLLEHGVTVHAAVRDPSNKGKLEHLTKVAEQSTSKGGSIKFFRGDLLDEGSYEEGMKGCSVVFHTASPFAFTVKDPQKELVTPAVDGTKNVLNSVNKTESVMRVILTSSVVAIFCDAADTYKAPNGVLTEDCINMTSSLEYQPYAYSKTMAEMVAWQMAGSQTRWSMATINPSFVMGPGLKYHETSESFKAIVQMGGGELSAGVPRFAMGVVDVRDVAHAHIAAAYKSGVTGRHILSGHNTDFVQMADVSVHGERKVN